MDDAAGAESDEVVVVVDGIVVVVDGVVVEDGVVVCRCWES